MNHMVNKQTKILLNMCIYNSSTTNTPYTSASCKTTPRQHRKEPQRTLRAASKETTRERNTALCSVSAASALLIAAQWI